MSTATDPKAYSIAEFCELHGISRGMLYKLWKANQGPRAFKVGRRTLISTEAAAEWRAKFEANRHQ